MDTFLNNQEKEMNTECDSSECEYTVCVCVGGLGGGEVMGEWGRRAKKK